MHHAADTLNVTLLGPTNQGEGTVGRNISKAKLSFDLSRGQDDAT